MLNFQTTYVSIARNIAYHMDEAVMTHRYTLEAVERSIRDLCNRNQIFGGKMVILGTYFM